MIDGLSCEMCAWDGSRVDAEVLFGMDQTPLCEMHAAEAEGNYEAAARDLGEKGTGG